MSQGPRLREAPKKRVVDKLLLDPAEDGCKDEEHENKIL